MLVQQKFECIGQKKNIYKTINVCIIFSDSKFIYDIPCQWSINKIKCLIATEIPMLQFDQFQLGFNKNLLRGNYQLYQVLQHFNQIESNQITFEIIKSQSQISFKKYYRDKMGKLLASSAHADQPVLNTSFQRAQNMINKNFQQAQKQFQQNMQNLGEEQLQRIANQGNEQPRIFRALRLFGVYLFFNILKNHGTLYQGLFIGLIILVYALIEWQRRRNFRLFARNNQNNRNNNRNANRNEAGNANNENQNANANIGQNEQGNKIQALNNIRAQILLRVFKIIEVIYVFLFSFFPNWEIRVHLHRNAAYINKAKIIVNQYRPQTYQTDRQEATNNANIAENSQPQQQNQQRLQEEDEPTQSQLLKQKEQ